MPDGRHTAQWERVAANAPLDRQHGRIRQHEVGDGVGLDGEDPRGETVPLVLLEQRRIAHLMEELFVDLIGSQPLDDLAFHQLPVDLLGEAADGGIRRQRAGETAFDAPRLRIAEAQIELGEREHALDCGPRRQFLEDQFLPVGVGQRDGRNGRSGVVRDDPRSLPHTRRRLHGPDRRTLLLWRGAGDETHRGSDEQLADSIHLRLLRVTPLDADGSGKETVVK